MFFFIFFFYYSFYDHEDGTLYKTNRKKVSVPGINHEVNTLEKTPTKYPYDRLRKKPLKNRTIKNSNDNIVLKEQNQFSPVSRSFGGGSEYLETFSPKQLMRSRRVRGVPDNGICLKQCCNGDNVILINI